MRVRFQNARILMRVAPLAAWLALAPLAYSRAAALPANTAPSTATLTVVGAAVGAHAVDVSSEMRGAIQSAIAKVYPALVRINVVTSYPSEGRLSKEEEAGSGVIISPEGHVITNHHVAGKALRAVCRMPDGEEIEATLVGSDALADIAVLKLDLAGRKDPAKPLPVAVFGDSSQVHVGDRVLAMGSPMGMTQTVTLGIVSNTALMLPVFAEAYLANDGEQTGSLVRWIGHDASIFAGNSGGPLVSFAGEIIGINEVGVARIGGAIPADLAQSVAEQIVQFGAVKRSWIGASCQPRLKGSALEKGVLVSAVFADSPAAKAGMRPGDFLLSFGGVATDARIREDIPNVNRIVQSTPVGKAVPAVVLRDGKEVTLTMTTEGRDKAKGKDVELHSWGMTAQDLTRLSALEMRRPDANGVLVGSLRAGGPAAEAKPPLQEGDIVVSVNGKPVSNTEALRATCDELTKGQKEAVPLLVQYDREFLHFMTVVKVGKEPSKEEPALAKKAWLSAKTQVLTQDLAKALNLDGKTGVRVTRVFPGRSAEKAGLQVGDVLLKLDGDAIEASRPEDSEVLSTLIRQRRIGDEATFDVMREGKAMQIKIALEAPATQGSELKHYEDVDFEFSVRDMTYEERLDEQTPESQGGVLIDMVQRAGWAALARVHSGDILLGIDGTPIANVADLETSLKQTKARTPKLVVFFIKRGVQTMYLELEPIWDRAAAPKAPEGQKPAAETKETL
jgi:serine protease Do